MSDPKTFPDERVKDSTRVGDPPDAVSDTHIKSEPNLYLDASTIHVVEGVPDALFRLNN
jgi:hypothetical protein